MTRISRKPSAEPMVRRRLSTPGDTPVTPPEGWKLGNEWAPYHPSASHVDPGYRDGWNAAYRAAPTPGPTVATIMVQSAAELLIGFAEGVIVGLAKDKEQAASVCDRLAFFTGRLRNAISQRTLNLESLARDHDRYELVRTLTPVQFVAVVCQRNMAGERFDDIIDEMVASRAAARSAPRAE